MFLSGVNAKRAMHKACGSLIVASSLLLAACADSVRPEDLAASPADAHADYHIGSGDGLDIVVYNHADLSTKVTVRPDGVITIPLVADMHAEGKTPKELELDLEKSLSEYVRSPKVNVIVTGFVGTYADQIRVVGQAAHPQALPYKAGMTLLDVMIAVGGVAEFAAGNRATLVRKIDGKDVTIKVKLDDLIHKGDIKANMPVRPGDVLIIPESRF